MELVILTGMGLVGYYMGTNDQTDTDMPQASVRIPPNQIPSALDIYNQNRLSVTENKQKDMARKMYETSLQPKKTNIIPTSYNKLAPYMKESKPIPNQYNIDPITLQYNPAEDTDYIYQDIPYRQARAQEMLGTHNEIFKSADIDTGHLFLNDEYAMFEVNNRKKQYKIPRVARTIRSNPVSKKQKRTAEQIIKNYKDLNTDTNTPDKDLLNISESLTDNADSIRNILSQHNKLVQNAFESEKMLPHFSDTPFRVESEKEFPYFADTATVGDKQYRTTPTQLARSGRLVGVTPDYKSILVDDQTAAYPAFDRPGQTVSLRAKNPSDLPYEYTSEPRTQFQSQSQFATDGTTENQSQSESNPNQNSFLYQFEDQTYDNMGLPGAANDTYQTETSDKTKLADIERQLAFQGGWTTYTPAGSMSYGIVSDDQLVHDNQIPFFKEKTGYGSNDLHSTQQMDRNRDLFTGNPVDYWKKKQEVGRHFEPVKDLAYIYGTPVRPEGEESRMFTSRYRNNEKLFQDERVTPGLNLDYNEIGTQGYNNLVRAYPKTVDELRVASRQKVTHEGRMGPGQKGSEGPVQGAVISKRPDGFKITTEADFLPTTDINTGPKNRENFVMKETDRTTTSVEYTGGAFNKADAVDQIGPDSMKPLVKYSTKPTFVLPKPLQKYARDETVHNPNLVSYAVTPTARSDTGNNAHVGPATDGASVYSAPTDSAKITTREQMPAYAPTNMGTFTMRGTAIQMDLTKPTIRQTTAEQMLNPHAPNFHTQQRVYTIDDAKQTVGETTQDQIDPSNIYSATTTYANPTDTAQITTRESTVTIPQNTHLLAVGQAQRQPNFTDHAVSTLKEQTIGLQHPTFRAADNHSYSSIQDPLKSTGRESTGIISQSNFITPNGQSQRAPNYTDHAKNTIGETLSCVPQNMFLNPTNTAITTHIQDPMRPTQREDLGQIPQNMQIAPPNNSIVSHLQDPMRSTLRQDTIQIAHPTFTVPVNQSQRAPNYTDTAKHTMAETLNSIPRNNFIAPINSQSIQIPLQDTARTTVAESTCNIPYNMSVQLNQNQRAPNFTDHLRPTLKGTTSQQQQNTFVGAVNKQMGSVPLQTPMRPTNKESIVQISPNTFVDGSNQSVRSDQTDPARPTLREEISVMPKNNFVQAVGQAQGTVPLQSVMRPTIKEQTIDKPVNTLVTGAIGPTVQLQDQARQTIQETTVNNKHIGAPTNAPNGSGYGYISTCIDVPNTNRQFTVQEVYVPPLEGITKAREYTDAYNAQVCDIRESTQLYRYPTLSNKDKGPHTKFTQTHLKPDTAIVPILKPLYAVNNSLDRPVQIQTNQTNRSTGQVPLTMFVDPAILKQLQTNPFSMPAYYPNTQ